MARRNKFGATLEATLRLAMKLATMPAGAAVEAQDAMRLVTMVRPPSAPVTLC